MREIGQVSSSRASRDRTGDPDLQLGRSVVWVGESNAREQAISAPGCTGALVSAARCGVRPRYGGELSAE